MILDDIIRMAEEACYPDAPFRQYVGGVDCGLLMKDEHLERFAELVSEAEREQQQYLKMLEDTGQLYYQGDIRARSNTGIKWEIEP